MANDTGTFVYEHEIGFGGGYTASSCRKEGGRWQSGACYFMVADTVELSRENELLTATVNTIRTNGRDCQFQGAAKEVSSTELLATMESEEWLDSGDELKVVPAICELKLTFLDPDTLRVEKLDAAKCASICGTSLIGLDIPQARRVSSIR